MKKNTNQPTFEESLQQLEIIVNNMENGKLTLEENITKFEEGMKLAKICNQKLAETEKKIEILITNQQQEETWQPLQQNCN